jgi:hypothetical protein
MVLLLVFGVRSEFIRKQSAKAAEKRLSAFSKATSRYLEWLVQGTNSWREKAY